MSNPSCPSESELRKLVAGTGTPEEQAALAQHIDGCPACQNALDRFAAGSDSWRGMAEHLAKNAVIDPALADVMDQLHANPQETTAEPHDDHDGSLDFLDPPEQPGHLGRMGHYQ